jgi:hypothetical protein
MALVAVAGGAGWGRLARAAGPRGGAVVAVGLAVWMALGAPARMTEFDRQSLAVEARADAEETLGPAIAAAGGPRRLLACGPFHVSRFSVPMVDWYLGVAPRPGPRDRAWTVTLQERVTRAAPYWPPAPPTDRTAASNGHWRILTGGCAAPAPGGRIFRREPAGTRRST